MAEKGKSFIRIPRKIEAGDVILVQSRIMHPQFNGRTKVKGEVVPMDYLKEIQISYGNEEVLTLKASASLSTNPQFDFKLKVAKEAEIKITWVDNHGEKYQATKAVTFG